ncbi:putative fatty-acid--CoA ligase FadD10, partial [Irineochytrium annulatum]
MPFTSSIPDIKIPDGELGDGLGALALILTIPSFGSLHQKVDIYTVSIGAGLKENPDATFLVDAETGAMRTLGEQARIVDRFVNGLHQNLGFKRWDVVGIYAPNHMDYATVAHGTIKAAGTITSANPAYTAIELAFQLTDAGARFLFTTAALLPIATEAAKIAGLADANILLLGESDGGAHRTVEDILSDTALAVKVAPFTKKELAEKPAYICYSSGTTGRPKGVVTTHRNLVASITQNV